MSEKTDPRVGEIRARLDAATPGPWVVHDMSDAVYSPDDNTGWWWVWQESKLPYYGGVFQPNDRTCGDGAIVEATIDDNRTGTQEKRDAEFIAAAPADVAYLLAELADRDEKLARVEKVRQELFDISNDEGWTIQHRAAYRDASRAIRAAVAASSLSCTIHADCVKGEVRAEFAGSSTPTTDVAYLLTELQALAAELSRDAENAQHYAEHGYGNADGVREAIFGAEVATRIRAAVAAAKGGERG